jgi:hypothetical protein
VDLTLVVSTSQRDTDIGIETTLPAPSLPERVYQHYWEHNASWRFTLGASVLLLGVVSWAAAFAVGSGLLVAGAFGGPEDDLRPDADDPARTVTPAQLFRIVCADINRLVDETNLVGAVGPRD